MKDKKIILIGGAPTTGKSTVAQALAKELDLPWLSMDQIRNTMRVVADKDKHPNLFNGGRDAETFLTSFTASEIVDKEIAQSEAAWLGIKAFIEEDYTWPKGFIIEGVNVLPHLVARDFSDNPDVRAVFLIDRDNERMRKVVYERGLWADANDYPDYVKEKEMEWATLFGERLEEVTKEHGFPLIEIHKTDNDVNQVLSALND
jgi:2-phosphoglycerate kinase